ncbi:ATP-binding protein [Bacillus sp. FJAT-45350]|uniref:ATP-binding protein n=1 Tax=Bacillus sp. FJAT-45350 TaxID=2011014 RepID=UPI000BB9B518|nr:ATP-binding protein [Bacillus sp. FJAT-45350]
MKIIRKNFNWKVLTKSFSFRILVVMLIVAIIPIIIFGTYSMKFVKTSLDESASNSTEAISEHLIEVYQRNILGQAQHIDLELKLVEQNVMMVKQMTEEIFQNQDTYMPIEEIVLTKAEEGYYWDQIVQRGSSNVGVLGQREITVELLDNLSRSKYLEPLFQQSLKQNDNISAIYFIMPDSSWRIFPAMNLEREVSERFFDPSTPITDYPFYQSALTNNHDINRTIWTEPYLDVTHRMLMFSSTTPVYDNETLLGVVGADITIETVINNILNIKFKDDNAYSFLVDKEGSLIAIQENGIDHFKALEIKNRLANNKQLPKISYLQDDNILLSSVIPTTDWYLGYVLPKESLVGPIKVMTTEFIKGSESKIITQIALMSFLLLCLCIMLSIMLRTSITTPINDLIYGFSKLGTGTTDIITKSKFTEFQHLTDSFNSMSSHIDYLLHQLENRLEEKEHLHNELIQLNYQLEQIVEARTKELITTNRQLTEKNKELKKVQKARSELISNLSHDFKTPLTVISGYIEAFQDGIIPKEEEKMYLEKMNQRILSLNRLVKDMHELSSLESNKSILRKEKKSLLQIIELIEMGTKTKPIDKFAVKVYWDKELKDTFHSLSIEVDIVYLNRALDNIIENAIKYGDSDKPLVIEVKIEHDNLTIDITNEGQGIQAEHLPHLFKRTYRVDKARNSKKAGHGLGLAIVKEIIEAHNGKVSVSSEVGKTTTFTLEFPLY